VISVSFTASQKVVVVVREFFFHCFIFSFFFFKKGTGGTYFIFLHSRRYLAFSFLFFSFSFSFFFSIACLFFSTKFHRFNFSAKIGISLVRSFG
jgi:hypothetical protein